MASSRLRNLSPWIPAALAVIVIAIESTATMSADNTSRWLLPVWVHLFGPITPERWAVVHHYIRKTGHFTGYGLVSLAFFHGWRKTLQLTAGSLRALWVRSAVLAVGCTIMVASADEFHQTFLPGRTGRVADVGLDTLGALAIQLMILALMPVLQRRPSKQYLTTLSPELE